MPKVVGVLRDKVAHQRSHGKIHDGPPIPEDLGPSNTEQKPVTVVKEADWNVLSCLCFGGDFGGTATECAFGTADFC